MASERDEQQADDPMSQGLPQEPEAAEGEREAERRVLEESARSDPGELEREAERRAREDEVRPTQAP